MSEKLDELREELEDACMFAIKTMAPTFQENMWITDYDSGKRIARMAKMPWGELARFAQWIDAIDGMHWEQSEWYSFEDDFKPVKDRVAMMLADLVMVATTGAHNWAALDELAAWDLGFLSDAAGAVCIGEVYDDAEERKRNQ